MGDQLQAAALRWCGQREKATGSSTALGAVIRCSPCQSCWPPFSLDVGHKTHLTSHATDHPRSHYVPLTDSRKLADRHGYKLQQWPHSRISGSCVSPTALKSTSVPASADFWGQTSVIEHRFCRPNRSFSTS